MNPSRRLLYIGTVWPEPTSSAAGVRNWNLIDLFQQRGWEVLYVSPAKSNPFREDLETRGVRTALFEPNDPAFDPWVAGLRPDAVLFDRFIMEEQFGWRVEEHSPDSIRILDTQDIHSLRRARETALSEGRSLQEISNVEIPWYGDDLLRELSSIYRCDLTLIISDRELDLLESHWDVPDRLLLHFPLGYPGPRADSLPFDQRRDFVCIGNFRHPPNRDGVGWLHREIWPGIRKRLPHAEVHLYGAYPPKDVMALDDPSTGFRVKGWAEDAVATLGRYRVNLAPLRFGAGIKGKIADGWVAGTPAVTTPIGAEGMMGADLTFGGWIAGDATSFVDHGVHLHERETDWTAARSRGWAILTNRFSMEKITPLFWKKFELLESDLESARRKNITGAMLRHHLHKSTKYMARWIELKNRNQPLQ